MKLLVVEDEHRMRSYLHIHRGLKEGGFVVDTAENDAGLHLTLTEDYAVVIFWMSCYQSGIAKTFAPREIDSRAISHGSRFCSGQR